MLKLVEFRAATAADLKADQKNLKVGQTYAISEDNGQTVNGIFSIRGDEDPFILKQYLENGQLLVPVNDPNFHNWIASNEEFETVTN